MTACRAADCERPTSAFLCRACADELSEAFGDLPGLVNDVLDAATRQARVYRATSHKRQPDPDWRGSPDAIGQSPMPLDPDAIAMLDRVRNTLTTWARHLIEARGLPAPDMRVPAIVTEDVYVTVVRNRWRIIREPRIIREQRTRSLAELVRWLLAHADTIRLDEAAGEIHRDIVGLRDDLLRAVDRSPSPFYAGPCHAQTTEPTTTTRDGTIYVQTVSRRCERQLYAWPGAKEIRCDGYRSSEPGDEGCGAVHTFAERDAWLRDAVEEALLTIDEMASVLPRMFKAYPQPPRSVMHAWVRQGRLVAHGLNHAGQPTFTGADMLELIARYRPKTFAPRPGRKAARMAS